MEQETKILLFEYTIFKLIEWLRAVAPRMDVATHFSRLASLKFLFLVSAIKAPTYSEDTGASGWTDLLDVFGNYLAMQYGPVEMEIYTAMATKQTKNYFFGNRVLSGTATENSFDTLPIDLKNRVDHSICTMRNVNPDIITYDPFRLVEITHKWEAWQLAISTAEWFGRRSEPMSVESIRNSQQYYA